MEDDDAINLVERSDELFRPDHLGRDSSNGTSGQGESVGEEVERDAVVVRSIGEKVGSESFFLDFSVTTTRDPCQQMMQAPAVSTTSRREYSPGKLLLDLGSVVQQ